MTFLSVMLNRTMNLYRILNCIFIVIVLGQNATFGQVRVTAELDSTHMLIGDRMQLHLRIQHPATAALENVDLSKLEKDEHIEIYNNGSLDTLKSGNSFLLEQNITFTILDSGTFIVPPIVVNFNQKGNNSTMKTNDLVMEVFTPAIDSIALAPIKPIIKEPMTFRDVLPWVLGVSLLALLVGGIFYLLKRRKKEEAPPPPVRKIPAHEIALEKFDELQSKQLWQQGEVKAYQSELTYIIREYLENRYHIQALESTTSEIEQQLMPLDFDQSMKGELNNMLQVADMVKFAKAKPPEDFHDQVMEQAKTFVVKTKPEIEVVEYVDAEGNIVPSPGSEQKEEAGNGDTSTSSDKKAS